MGYNWGYPGATWGHDGAWTWMMGMHGLLWLLFVILLVVGIVLLVRVLWRGGAGAHSHAGGGRTAESALAVLEARYAKGEIGRDEFHEKKKDLAT